jgi:hypothetical protein
MRIELLLDHCLRPCLLARRLMLGLELDFAALADSNNRNVLDAFHDAKIALRHGDSFQQFGWLVWDGQGCPSHTEPPPLARKMPLW